jgi:diguanylate cyclase (GGDEF)-like protein
LSISRKLSLLVASSVALALLAASALSIWIDSRRQLEAKQRELHAVASAFASAASGAVAERDRVAARNAIRAIGRVAGMQYAQIRLPGGAVLADIGTTVQLDGDLRIDATHAISVWRAFASRSVQLTVPITDSGSIVGEFVLVGDASDLTATLLQTLKLAALCGLFALTVGLLVAARLHRSITAPLRALTAAMERVRATHDYAARIEATSRDEVGELVDGFNATLNEIRARDRDLERLAYYDPLTGLGNRSLFGRALKDRLQICRTSGVGGALLLLDLDSFKEVNDTLGHATGDELLLKVSQIVAGAVPKDHVLARLGGDEFAVIVPECRAQEAVEQLAQSLIAAVAGTLSLRHAEVTADTSIGVVLFPRDGATAGDIMRNADLALYRAKEEGRGRFVVFRPEMHEAIESRTALARDLRSALSQGTGLCVHYQPQIELSTGRVTGFEALTRWSHPTLGNVPPSAFIPVAESSRLIGDLGLWVLREAASQAKAWLDAGEPAREVSVNVSAAQLRHGDIVREVAGVLAETGLPPHLLCIELTESLLADNAEGRVQNALAALEGLGVKLALDDFGTDYSSLGYLTQLPFDKLKIDRIFVDGIVDSQRARELLKGIVALGHGLGMTVIAEGVERQGEVEIVREFGCNQAQGYAFARPGAAADAIAFARSMEALADRSPGERVENGRSAGMPARDVAA